MIAVGSPAWWKLYREERKKLAPDRQELSSVEIVRASREASRRAAKMP